MKVDIRDAHLPDLVAALRAGEEVVIEEEGREVARLVRAEAPGGFRFGSLSHLAGTVPDFEPMSNDELDQLEREKEERIFAATGYRFR